jgi:hypothetical protein
METAPVLHIGHAPVENLHEQTEVWLEEFNKVQETPPQKGDILVTQPNFESDRFAITNRVKIKVDLQPGKSPLMYALAVIPAVVGGNVGWFCRDQNDPSNYGFKCILLPNARDNMIRTRGLPKDGILSVKSLKVVKLSISGTSLLCEVNET